MKATTTGVHANFAAPGQRVEAALGQSGVEPEIAEQRTRQATGNGQQDRFR